MVAQALVGAVEPVDLHCDVGLIGLYIQRRTVHDEQV